MTSEDLFWLGVSVIALGALVVLFVVPLLCEVRMEKNKGLQPIIPDDEKARGDLEDRLSALRAEYPDLPPVPALSLRYKRWTGEVGKWFALAWQQLASRKQIEFARRLNEFYGEYLKLLDKHREVGARVKFAGKLEYFEGRKIDLQIAQVEANIKALGGPPAILGMPGFPSREDALVHAVIAEPRALAKLETTEEFQVLSAQAQEETRQRLREFYAAERRRILESIAKDA